MRKLGPDAAQVQVLFVTVDPRRDKPELLRQYLPAFDPSFIGLYGDAQATQKVTSDFKVYAQERPGKTPDTYTVDHAAQTFVFDKQGKLRLVMGYGMAPDAIASDVRILLNSSELPAAPSPRRSTQRWREDAERETAPKGRLAQ
jgi:protein SCO1/2